MHINSPRPSHWVWVYEFKLPIGLLVKNILRTHGSGGDSWLFMQIHPVLHYNKRMAAQRVSVSILYLLLSLLQ